MTWRWVAENRIREAQATGAFEGLRGEGQPLRIEDDSQTALEWRLAYRMLRNAGLAPAWLELDQQIREDAERARRELAAEARRGGEQGTEMERAREVFRSRLEVLNRQIDELNLKVPSPRWQRGRLDPAVEERRSLEGLPHKA